jgi:hypothetical protein
MYEKVRVCFLEGKQAAPLHSGRDDLNLCKCSNEKTIHFLGTVVGTILGW